MQKREERRSIHTKQSSAGIIRCLLGWPWKSHNTNSFPKTRLASLWESSPIHRFPVDLQKALCGAAYSHIYHAYIHTFTYLLHKISWFLPNCQNQIWKCMQCDCILGLSPPGFVRSYPGSCPSLTGPFKPRISVWIRPILPFSGLSVSRAFIDHVFQPQHYTTRQVKAQFSKKYCHIAPPNLPSWLPWGKIKLIWFSSNP